MKDYANNFTNNNFEYITSFEMWVSTLILILISYLIGSINSGQILSKLKNRDLGNTGSSNYGATNAGRAFGVKGFVFVFMGDFLKPIVLGGIYSLLWYYVPFFNKTNIGFALLFVFVGHVWPIWFGFRGGKGIASFFGLVTIYNPLVSAMGGILFLIYLYLSRRVGLSSISSIFSVALILTFQPVWPPYLMIMLWSLNWGVVVSIWIAFIISFIKHIPNLKIFVKEYKEYKSIKG